MLIKLNSSTNISFHTGVKYIPYVSLHVQMRSKNGSNKVMNLNESYTVWNALKILYDGLT
jgi:hypothetical protein